MEGVTAHSVLHAFYGGPNNLVGKLGWLDEEAIERLRPPPMPHRRGPVRLDDGDRKLLALLATDGRAGFEQLAAATGWSPTTVRRRMTELREHGLLSLDIDVDWRMFGAHARTLLWLSLAHSTLLVTRSARSLSPAAREHGGCPRLRRCECAAWSVTGGKRWSGAGCRWEERGEATSTGRRPRRAARKAPDR